MLSMVVRLPGSSSNVPGPSIGSSASFPLPTDPRRDMIKEMIAARLVAEFADAESKLKEIVETGESKTQRTDRKNVDSARPGRTGATTTSPPTASTTSPATTPDQPGADKAATDKPTPTSEQVQRALQRLQRDAGLPVTGRFDDATAALLAKLGIVKPADGKADAKPATPTPAPTTPSEPKAERKPIDLAGQAQRRQAAAGQEQLLKARLQPPLPASAARAEGLRADGPRADGPRADAKDSAPVDRVLDPARLLASLVAAGFSVPGGGASEALQAFQASKGLPPSGQLDKATAAALGAAGVVSAEAASALANDHAVAHAGEGKNTSTSAASTGDRVDVTSNSKGSGAASQAATTRAPAASPEEARERARLESLLAQAQATERGVQQNTGDLAAVIGHAPTPGQATGVSGRGGTGGGADTGGDEAAHAIDGDAGDESSAGHSHAGDDDHDNEDRGDAVAAGQADDDRDPDGLIPDGHHRVEKLSVQVLAALDTITRLDDDTGPVHYTWDVTLYRPGVYSDGQPAEAVWHLVVDRAHAFDPVWERATHAIAARLLYVEPDADAPTLEDVLGALRRARVR